MIFEGLTVGSIGSNCYIVGSEISKRGMVIDPGSESTTILNKVKSLGLKIEMIVATHSHFDHVGAVRAMKEATGAIFAVGGSTETTPASFAKAVHMISGGFTRVPDPDRILREGDVIDIDDLHFQVIFTPGHSPDEICLYGHGILFSGDTIFCEGIGRTDFPGCSFEQLAHSIKNKLYKLPDDTLVYPGHGPETTIGDEKRGNPFIR